MVKRRGFAISSTSEVRREHLFFQRTQRPSDVPWKRTKRTLSWLEIIKIGFMVAMAAAAVLALIFW